jgi:hypothetical protein
MKRIIEKERAFLNWNIYEKNNHYNGYRELKNQGYADKQLHINIMKKALEKESIKNTEIWNNKKVQRGSSVGSSVGSFMNSSMYSSSSSNNTEIYDDADEIEYSCLSRVCVSIFFCVKL